MTQINSREFYLNLLKGLQAAALEIDAMGAPKAHFFISAHMPMDYDDRKELQINIIVDSRTDSVKVTGKNLGEMVEEYIRRSSFETRQKMLQIEGPKEPISEEHGEVPVPAEEDEIPY